MRNLLLGLVALFSVIAQGEPNYITFPSDVDWVTRRAEHFQIIFRRGEDRLAERTLIAAEKAYKVVRPIFPESPDSTWIVLADFQDSLNGYSLDFPFPHFVIFASPPDAHGDLEAFDDWLDSVVLHEFVHTLHLYPAHGYWKLARWIFGSAVLPNGLMPTHFHEGLATFLETELTTGGRGRGAHFKMYTRVAVDEKVWGGDFRPYDLFEGSPIHWPHGASPYYFGNLFYEELWRRKGARGIHDLTLKYSRILLPYFLNGPLEDVYGADYPTLWNAIFDRKRQEAERELAEIRRHPLSPLNYLTDSRFSKWDVVYSPSGRQVAFRRGEPKKSPGIEIREVPSGKLLETVDTDGPAIGLCWGASGKREFLLFTEPHFHNNYTLDRLVLFELGSRERRVLKMNGRDLEHVHGVGCSPDLSKVVAYREYAGNGTIEEYAFAPETKGSELKRLRDWHLAEGDWATSLLWNDGPWFLARRKADTVLYRWDAKLPTALLTIPGHAYNLRRLPETNELAFVSSRDGRDEVWRLSRTGEMRKAISLIGGANSFDVKGGNWALTSYRQGGYDLALAKPVSDTRTWKVESAAAARPAANREPAEKSLLSARTEEYSAWPTLLPRTWIPSVLFVPDGIQFGAFIPGFDVAQKHAYSVFGGYDTRGLPFLDAVYQYRFHQTSALVAEPYFLPSYLISTRSFFKQWGTILGVSTKLDFLPIRIQLSALFSRVEQSSLSRPARQNVGLGLSVTGQFGYRIRPLAFAPSRGTTVSVAYNQYRRELGSDDNFFSLVAGVDQFIAAPWWDDHVFKLSAHLGYTEGTVLYNSFYQAGGELIFSSGQGTFLNRGFLPGTFFGRRIASFNLEYRFPIARIERGHNLWPFFLHRIHAGLVGDATTYDLGASDTRLPPIFHEFFASTGLELKTDWTLFFYLPALIRVGVYHGFGPYGEPVYGTMAIEAAI